MTHLDATRVTLDGRHLVEASAGSGKTRAITTIFVRLIVEKKLEVSNIVVLTYTRAATQELRQRLVARLRDMRRALSEPIGDQELDSIAATMTSSDRSDASRRLGVAIARFDEAAVYTIHGLCHRILTEHALLAAVPPGVEVMPRVSALVQELAHDFCHTELGKHPWWAIEGLQARDVRPEALAYLVGQARAPTTRLIPEPGEANLDEIKTQWDSAFAQAADRWRAEKDEVLTALCESPALHRGIYKADKIVNVWAPALHDLFSAQQYALPPWFRRVSTSGIATKGGLQAPQLSFFGACEALLQADRELGSGLDNVAVALRTKFIKAADRRLADHMHTTGHLGYDDLLLATHRALRGANGSAIAEALRQSFCAALVDEFQDTDAIQFDILDAVYGGTEAPLFLIGDPKQAIYAFRGADVFSYLQASRDAQTHTLANNWRSTPTLVAATNALFTNRLDPFALGQIEFGPATPTRVDDGTPLDVVWLSKPDEALTRPEIQARAVESAADLVCQRLADRTPMPGEPEIAVLCRTNNQARLVHSALGVRGVAATLDGDACVFDTETARELHWIMAAVSKPGDHVLMRRALATSLVGPGPTLVMRVNDDDVQWQRWGERLSQWSARWRDDGFMGFFHQFLAEANVRERLADRIDGHRWLTDLVHISELLNRVAVHERLKPHRLVQRFGAFRTSETSRSGFGQDEMQQRPDRESQSVLVTTIHKSKGLEFAEVLVPFLADPPWLSRMQDRAIPFHDPSDGDRFKIDLGSDALADHKELAKMEALSEALRVLYVAVTRARDRCTLFWGSTRGWDNTAFGYLLARGARRKADHARDDLCALVERTPAVQIVPPPEPTTYTASNTPQDITRPTQKLGNFDRRAMTSFSAWAEHQAPVVDPFGFLERRGTDPADLGTTFAQFPGGAVSGIAIHRILELALRNPTLSVGDVAHVLGSHGLDAELAHNTDLAVSVVLDTPLLTARPDMTLRALRNHQSEVEFTLGGPSGFCRGFIDLVFEFERRWYLVDYKSNILGTDFSDYEPSKLAATVAEHRYDVQSRLYALALHRHLGARLADYAYQSHFGGTLIAFVRGMRGAEHPQSGVFFERHPAAVIDEIDSEFDGMIT